MSKEAITLYYREGGSDKVYNASIEEVPGGYEVHFSYGRRGSSLTLGKKTTFPVSLVAAEKIYNKLVSEKTSKGYKETGISTGMASSLLSNSLQVIDSGVRPQLLNEVDENAVEHLLQCDHWCAQEKFDGRRRMFIKTGMEITATNRKGLAIPTDAKFINHLKKISMDCILDGEDMGGYVMLFDVLDSGVPYQTRYTALHTLFSTGIFEPEFKVVETAWTTEEKRALYERLKRDNAEGIVFKKVDSLYMPGRPNSGGDQLKFKFCATATCYVESVSPVKRSVALSVYFDENTRITVGNCTVYPNMEIPKIGELVEVRYLYYFEGGSLFQPVLLGTRDDLDISDCKLSQLKRKREDGQAEG